MAMPNYELGGSVGLGGIATFNMLHGFPEALVRGMRTGFLRDADYHHLTQCENLEDVKMNLMETDYGAYLQNETGISPQILETCAMNKLVMEFNYLKSHSIHPLTSFLEYITYEYMIENVMLLLRGSLSGRNINDLIAQCHPLGMFKESIMRSIPHFEASAKGYADLYETVLVDTPIGPYFQQYLDSESEMLSSASDMKTILEETQIEILRNSLMKLYLEDFYTFCDKMGGMTAELMCGLLSSRADKLAISLTLNSFGTPLNDPAMRETTRSKLYPSIGTLYPGATELLSKVDDDGKLVQVVSIFPMYRDMFDKFLNTNPEDFSIDDEFYVNDVKELELAFEQQCHLAVFYAYVKLREQEVRNIVWIGECVLQRMKSEVDNYIPIFSSQSPWRCEQTRRSGGH
jgi:V-type H+-transporting ATPase subunit d